MSSKRFNFLSQTIFFVAGLSSLFLPFVFWVKHEQLRLVSPTLLLHYPTTYWVESLLEGLCACLAVSLLWCVCILRSFKFKQLSRYLAFEVLNLIPLGLVWLGVSLAHCLLAVLLLKSLGLIIFRPQFKFIAVKWKEHSLVLFFIIFVQVAFNQFVSPLNWDNPLAATLRSESAYISFSHTTHKAAFALAKRLDFSQLERGEWGAFPFSLSGGSFVVPALTLLFDLPVIDVESYQRLLLALMFLGCVMGSFFFYLLLRSVFQFSLESASIGGVLFLISNSEFGTALTQYFPLFNIPFLFLPAALLLMHKAFTEGKAGWALCSGGMLGSSFYLIQSHPDSMNLAFGIWFLLSLLIGLRAKANFTRLGSYLFGASVIYALILLIFFLPVLELISNKEAKVVGHTEPELFFYGLNDGFSLMVVQKLRSLAPLLPFSLLGYFAFFRSQKINRNQRRDALLFMLLILSFIFLFIGGREGPLNAFLQWSHIRSLIFRTTMRIFMLYSFLLLFAILFGLEFLYQNIPTSKNTHRILSAASLGLALALFWREFVVLGELVPYACTFALLFTLFLSWKNGKLALNLAVCAGLAFLLAHETKMSFSSPKTEGNPQNCKPYVLVKTLLMKASFFPEDRAASARLLNKRLKQFERDSSQSLVHTEDDIFRRATLVADRVDSYYLSDAFCRFPAHFSGAKELSKTGPPHNVILLFEKMGSPFQWISSRGAALLGIGEGLIAQNFDLNPDNSVLTMFPPLNALYADPAPFMEDLGVRFSRAYFQTGLRQPVRRLLNIAGIDILTLDEFAYDYWSKEGDLEILPHTLSPYLRNGNLAVRDQRSYGMAYIAKKIHLISPALNDFENRLPPFIGRSWDYQQQYTDKVNELQGLLFKMKERHEIYLEQPENSGLTLSVHSANRVDIENISGAKAIFRSHCEASPCQLVFNHAALSGWRGYVEKLPLEIKRANFAFLSAELPLGDHFVWFELRSVGAIVGFYLSVGAVLLCLLWLLLDSTRPQPKRN